MDEKRTIKNIPSAAVEDSLTVSPPTRRLSRNWSSKKLRHSLSCGWHCWQLYLGCRICVQSTRPFGKSRIAANPQRRK